MLHCCKSAEDVQIKKCAVEHLGKISPIAENAPALDGICLGNFSNVKLVLHDLDSMSMSEETTEDTAESTVSRVLENGNCALAESGNLEGRPVTAQSSNSQLSQHFMYSYAQITPEQNLVCFSNEDVLFVSNPRQPSAIQTDMPGALYGGAPIHQSHSMGNWDVPPPPPPLIARVVSNHAGNIIPRQIECPLSFNPVTRNRELQPDERVNAPALLSNNAGILSHVSVSCADTPKSNGHVARPHSPSTLGMTRHSIMEGQGVTFGSIGQHASKDPSCKFESISSYATSSFVMSGKRPDWSAPSHGPQNRIPFMQAQSGKNNTPTIGVLWDTSDETVLLQNVESTGHAENAPTPTYQSNA